MKYIFISLFVFFSFAASAQSERFKKGGSKPTNEQESPKEKEPEAAKQITKSSWSDKWVFGGSGGLSFGTNTNIFLSPQVGYRLKDNLVVGAGYMYNYARWRSIFANGSFQNTNFENTIHGPNFFLSYMPLESLFLGAQFELLNHDAYLYNLNTLDFDVENRWTEVLFIQAGFVQRFNKKGMMQVGLRYNLLHDQNSPYSNSWAPIFLVYF